jgi:drug/metabolite transporter (DMT)-like permease
LTCLSLGVAALLWAVVQPWWGFPFDALGASVPLELGSADAPVWALSLWMVVLGTILPFVLSLGALHHLPATRVATVSMIEVLLAALVAWAWLGETLSAAQLVGGAVVLVGVVLAQTSR